MDLFERKKKTGGKGSTFGLIDKSVSFYGVGVESQVGRGRISYRPRSNKFLIFYHGGDPSTSGYPYVG